MNNVLPFPSLDGRAIIAEAQTKAWSILGPAFADTAASGEQVDREVRRAEREIVPLMRRLTAEDNLAYRLAGAVVMALMESPEWASVAVEAPL